MTPSKACLLESEHRYIMKVIYMVCYIADVLKQSDSSYACMGST